MIILCILCLFVEILLWAITFHGDKIIMIKMFFRLLLPIIFFTQLLTIILIQIVHSLNIIEELFVLVICLMKDETKIILCVVFGDEPCIGSYFAPWQNKCINEWKTFLYNAMQWSTLNVQVSKLNCTSEITLTPAQFVYFLFAYLMKLMLNITVIIC